MSLLLGKLAANCVLLCFVVVGGFRFVFFGCLVVQHYQQRRNMATTCSPEHASQSLWDTR